MRKLSVVVSITTFAMLQIGNAIQCEAQVTPPRQKIPIALSASGGIAAGTYQGGASYAVVEFLRRARAGTLPDTFQKQMAKRNRDFDIAAVAGASAGNINALLVAMSWCADALQSSDSVFRSAKPANIAPVNSLFWNIWVNTGLSELMPPSAFEHTRKVSSGMFNRDFFRRVHLATLRSFADSATPRPGCSVPIGLTLTKVTPFDYAIAPGLSAKAERMATVFRVVNDTNTHRIGFDTVSSVIRTTGSLGALVLPRELYNGERSDSVRWNSVINAVVASSAFPVAFGPQQFCSYSATDSVRLGQSHPCDSYLDGGAFDNNPFVLAIGLAASRNQKITLVYSNPGQLRAPLQLPRSPEPITQSGLSAVTQLIGGFIPAARQYELQLLARQTARDKEVQKVAKAVVLNERIAGANDQFLEAARDTANQLINRLAPLVTYTTRGAPIFGDRLGAFAGFFGRPWRVHDFYAGMYDGLQYVASQFLCDSAADSVCVRSTHQRLVEQNVLDADQLGAELLHAQQIAEYAPNGTSFSLVDRLRQMHPQLPDTDHALVVAASFDAIGRLRPVDPGHVPSDQCSILGVIGAMMCKDTIGSVVDAMHADKSIRNAAGRLRDQCARQSVVFRDSGQCEVDERFLRLVNSPSRFANNIAEDILRRLEITEDAILQSKKDAYRKNPNVGDYSATVEFAYMFYRSINYDSRDGFEWNPSSGRWDGGGFKNNFASFIGAIAPGSLNYVRSWTTRKHRMGSNSVLNATDLVENWSFARNVRGGWRAYIPFELSERVHGRTESTNGLTFQTGVGFRVRSSIPIVGGTQFVAKLPLVADGKFVSTATALDNKSFEAVRVFAYEKARIFGGYTPIDRSFRIGLGINDINGMLFWWLR